jgi:hypothetical protein
MPRRGISIIPWVSLQRMREEKRNGLQNDRPKQDEPVHQSSADGSFDHQSSADDERLRVSVLGSIITGKLCQ